MTLLPRLAEGRPVVCLASGPSLTTEDVEYVRGKAVVIAVNDVARFAAPWADVAVSVDSNWWTQHYKTMREFAGLKVRTHPHNHKVNLGRKPNPLYCVRCDARLRKHGNCWCDGIVTLANAGRDGFSMDPTAIVTTYNSGGAAINVAVHLGARRILLLGYDMGPDDKGRRHFFDTEATQITSPFVQFRKSIATMVPHLAAAGVEVINCTRSTRLECFPCQPLHEALPDVALRAAS